MSDSAYPFKIYERLGWVVLWLFIIMIQSCNISDRLTEIRDRLPAKQEAK